MRTYLGDLVLSKYLSSRKLDFLAILLLALTCVGFYWRILFGGAWMPSGGGDLVSFLWPTYTFAARSLRSGVLPLWNPYLYSGMPFAADNQSGLFYPVNLLVFLLVPKLTYFVMELMSVAHVWWAGVGMYILIRTMNARRVPAFAGALAWMFSEVFVIHFGNYNLIAVAAWLPLIFAMFRFSLSREAGEGWGGDLRCAFAAGALWGMASLAGHAQMMLFIGLWLGGYALFRTLSESPRHQDRKEKEIAFLELRIHAQTARGESRTRRPIRRVTDSARADSKLQTFASWRLMPLLLFAITALVAFAFAALMIIPANEMARYTGRAGLDYEEAIQYSLPPAGLVGLVVPGLFGQAQAHGRLGCASRWDMSAC